MSFSLRTQAPERIERYFEGYKTQIDNSLAGIGQPANGKERWV